MPLGRNTDRTRSMFRFGPDALTLEQCTSNIAVTGITGGGKSSGLESILRWMLAEGCGMVFLCAKRDDATKYLRMAEEEGRGADVLWVHKNSGHSLNFMQEELERPTGGTEEVLNALSVFTEVLQKGQADQHTRDSFWAQLAEEGYRHALNICWRALGVASPELVAQVINSSPASMEALAAPNAKTNGLCMRLLAQWAAYPHTPETEHELSGAISYFCSTLVALGSKGRGAVLAAAAGALGPFRVEPVRSFMMSGHTRLSPAAPQEGKVVIMDYPPLVWGRSGRLIGLTYLILAQNAALRRDPNKGAMCCFVIDEAQLWIHPGHFLKIAVTSRSQNCANIILVQSLPVLQSFLGAGDKAKQECDALLSNCATKFAFANDCPVTNEWYAQLAGMEFQPVFGGSDGADDPNAWDPLNIGKPRLTWSDQRHYLLEPSAFSRLRKGGRANGLLVDAIMFQSGREFSNGRQFREVTFRQYAKGA